MKEVDVLGIVKLLLTASVSAAVFYAWGYIITRAYVVATGLTASFWFTENSYREAGARFLHDVVVAAALAPHLFFPLAAIFLVLMPGLSSVLWRRRFVAPFRQFELGRLVALRDGAFVLVILLALGAIVLELVDCGQNGCQRFSNLPKWFFTSSWLLAGPEELWLLQQPRLYAMVVFLALAVPMTITLGLWTGRMFGLAGAEPGARGTHPVAAFLVASGFVLLMGYIPIAYGAYFYDLVVVRIEDADKCIRPPAPADAASAGQPAQGEEQVRQLECYVLGRFDETRYVLVGSDSRSESRKLYIRPVSVLEPFAVTSRSLTPMRQLGAGSDRSAHAADGNSESDK